MRNIAKMLIKKPFNVLGLDIVQLPNSQPEPADMNNFEWLSALNINTVFDIGAHTGEFATMIHGILPDACILSFEPLAASFQHLLQNMKDVPNFKAFKYALGDRDARQEMRRNEFAPSSSLLRMTHLHKEAFPYTVRETTETVEVKRLDDFAKDLDLQDSILVKIDVQGYEDKVILGGHNVISRAKLMIVETSFRTLYEGQPLFDDVYQMLKQKGFKYMGNFDQLKSPIDGSVLQADAIFIRS